jgi:hypothetical protein
MFICEHLRHLRTISESSPRAHWADFEGGEVFALAGELFVGDGGDQAALVHSDVLAAAVFVPVVAEAEAVDEGDHGGVIGNRRNGAEVLNFVEPATGVVAVRAVGLDDGLASVEDGAADVVEAAFSEQGEGGVIILGVEGGGELAGD